MTRRKTVPVVEKQTTAVDTTVNALREADRALGKVLDAMVDIEDTLGNLEAETTYRVRITLKNTIEDVRAGSHLAILAVERMAEKVRMYDEGEDG